MSKKIKIFRNKNTADLCKSVNEFCKVCWEAEQI